MQHEVAQRKLCSYFFGVKKGRPAGGRKRNSMAESTKREPGEHFCLKYPASKSPLFVRNTRKQWPIASPPLVSSSVGFLAKVLPKNGRCLCAVLWTTSPPSFQFAWSSPPEPVCGLLFFYWNKSSALQCFPLIWINSSSTLVPPCTFNFRTYLPRSLDTSMNVVLL